MSSCIKLVYQDGIPTAGFKFISCQEADKKERTAFFPVEV